MCIHVKSKSHIKKLKEFSFRADNYLIKNQASIKILGVYLNSELKIGQHLNSIISQCYNKVHSIKTITKYTDKNTRLKFINAHMISKILYMLPLISSANHEQFKKVHKLIMFSARTILGSYCFKVSCKDILDQINWLSSKQLIKWSIIKSIHKIIYYKKPENLYDYFKVNKRQCALLAPKIYPKKKFSRDFFLFKGIEYYNSVPNDILKCPPHIFKKRGLKYLKSNFEVH